MKSRSGNREERENVISETADEKEEKEAQREPTAEQREPDLLSVRQRGGLWLETGVRGTPHLRRTESASVGGIWPESLYLPGMPPDIRQSRASGSGRRSQPISAGGRTESIRRAFPGIKFPGDLREKLSVRKRRWRTTKNASTCRASERTQYMLTQDARKHTK